MDIFWGGLGSETIYECSTAINRSYNVKFSYYVPVQLRESEYCCSCDKSSNIFGSVGVRNKEYVILNKVYPKPKFFELRKKIIEHMDNMPYQDSKGRIYKYGEFFPFDLSPYAYNETVAAEFEPLSKDEATRRGLKWRDREAKNFEITMPAKNIPDDIQNVDEKILAEILGCRDEGKCGYQCTGAFKITTGELQFYKKRDIPLSDKCPNCRYYERFGKVPLPRLYDRSCMCDRKGHGHGGICPSEFKTPYAPERKESVYCESCYNKEVY